jgi:glycosyltransferase involved in cell wall biosynthesis
MARRKIVLTTNPPWISTGLSENGKFLAQYLQKTGKYDLVYYCSQVSAGDPNHARMPWKSFGAVPTDPQIIAQLNQDPFRARQVSYGAYYIDKIVKEEKPDILWCSDDVWSYQGDFIGAPWWRQINSILHVTVDSVPVLDLAYEQARSTPNYYTWASFAAKEMKKRGSEYGHVKQIYGATNVQNFSPLSENERTDLRRRFGIDQSATIFGYTFRNQLRKEALNILLAFQKFKQVNPRANVKLHLHTSWSETAAGWDFPRLIKYLGIDNNDILCTYICKACGGWHVRPYGGEDLDCPLCGAKKSNITVSIAHSVPAEEMKLVYGIRDATISPLTSGGLEFENVNTLLCGLPLATTNYSSGEDFCIQPFIYPIKWHPRFEASTSFMKATNDVDSITGFMEKIWKADKKERTRLGEQGRDWSAKTFSIDAIGPQWEKVFDALPPKDWSSITLAPKLKNPDYPMPQIDNPGEWIKALYKNILLCEPDPDGFKNWMHQLEHGVPREQIYQFFRKVAAEDNAKSQPPQEFGSLFDSNGRKRILFVIKESGGDVYMCTALFPKLKELYPDADLYVATEPRYFEILAGNHHVYKVLPYHPVMEQEMVMMQYVDSYYFPALATQRQLNYLTHDKIGLELEA